MIGQFEHLMQITDRPAAVMVKGAGLTVNVPALMVTA